MLCLQVVKPLRMSNPELIKVLLQMNSDLGGTAFRELVQVVLGHSNPDPLPLPLPFAPLCLCPCPCPALPCLVELVLPLPHPALNLGKGRQEGHVRIREGRGG